MTDTYRVDPNHSGIRLVVLLAIGLGITAGLLGVPALLRRMGLPAGLPLLIGIVAAAVLAAGFSWITEHILRRVWPSGRTLEVGEDRVILHERRGSDISIDWGDGLGVLSWRFRITTRRAWVPRGWYCLAFCLKRESDSITVYTFASPKAAEEVTGWHSFVELIPRKQAPDVGKEVFAGQEHLRAAEEQRWWAGAEMRLEDFEALACRVKANVPDWPGDRA